jgi:hypothetical protein
MHEKHDSTDGGLRDADAVLDRVLANYAGEPLAGMEERALARVRARQQSAQARGFFRAKWMKRIGAFAAATAAAAASLVIGVQIGQHRSDEIWQQRIASNATAWNSVKPAAIVNVPQAAAPTAARTVRYRTPRHNSPYATKPAAQFPSPAPMSQQERTLARLAANADPALLASLAQATAQASQMPSQNGEAAQTDSQVRPPQ